MQTFVGSPEAVETRKPLSSREGVPLREYRWGMVLMALPFAIFFDVVLRLWALVLRSEPVSDEKLKRIPSNAIVYLWHTEIYGFLPDWSVYERLFARGSVLGNHTFFSYVWSFGMYLRGFRVFRYRPGCGRRVLPEIVRHVACDIPGRFGLRTDSGGPYEKVRKSLVLMAIETNRPLVPMRQRYDRAFRLKQHWIPMPFAKATTVFGEPIPAEELRALPLDAALACVQERIDSI